jgi:hypothetical protein
VVPHVYVRPHLSIARAISTRGRTCGPFPLRSTMESRPQERMKLARVDDKLLGAADLAVERPGARHGRFFRIKNSGRRRRAARSAYQVNSDHSEALPRHPKARP